MNPCQSNFKLSGNPTKKLVISVMQHCDFLVLVLLLLPLLSVIFYIMEAGLKRGSETMFTSALCAYVHRLYSPLLLCSIF